VIINRAIQPVVYRILVLLSSRLQAAMRPQEPESKSISLEGVQRHSLVFNYSIRRGSIFYNYCDEGKGENIYDTAITVTLLSKQGLERKDNQIVYRKKNRLRTTAIVS
jgi:hypothetical protein